MPVHLTDVCDRAMTGDATDSPVRINAAPLALRITATCDREATWQGQLRSIVVADTHR